MKFSIIFILLFSVLSISCNQENKPTERKITQHQFNSISFEVNNNWKEYKRNDWLITFVDTEDTNSYKANFTIMILDNKLDSNNISMDSIIKSNLNELKDVYVKLNIITYDTNTINNYKCRTVSFASLTNEKEILGTVICLMKSEHSLIMTSFQGDNKGGAFEKRIKEIDEFIHSIRF